MLVAAEVALALVLLVGAGLLLQSFVRLVKVDLGFAPQNTGAKAPLERFTKEPCSPTASLAQRVSQRVVPVPTSPTNTMLAASATKRQSKTCRTASRSRSDCASNQKASSVFSIGEASALDAPPDTALPACGHL